MEPLPPAGACCHWVPAAAAHQSLLSLPCLDLLLLVLLLLGMGPFFAAHPHLPYPFYVPLCLHLGHLYLLTSLHHCCWLASAAHAADQLAAPLYYCAAHPRHPLNLGPHCLGLAAPAHQPQYQSLDLKEHGA
jgi:hypothetical protein